MVSEEAFFILRLFDFRKNFVKFDTILVFFKHHKNRENSKQFFKALRFFFQFSLLARTVSTLTLLSLLLNYGTL